MTERFVGIAQMDTPTRARMVNYNKLEIAEAKHIGATVHKNSGRGTKKGDASYPGITIDFKFAGVSFTVNKSVWAKACSDALSNHHSPAINVVMGEMDGPKTRLWVIEDGLFQDMRQAWMEKYDGEV